MTYSIYIIVQECIFAHSYSIQPHSKRCKRCRTLSSRPGIWKFMWLELETLTW